MNKEKRLGILFIIIGICIPLIALPYLSGYSKEKSFYDNFYTAAIEIRKDKAEAGASSGNNEKTKNNISGFYGFMPNRIPFRFFLVITVILLYMEITRIDSSRQKKEL